MKTIQTVRLSTEEIEKLLDRLDKSEDDRSATYKYRSYGSIVRVQRPGDSEELPFSMPTRRLGVNELVAVHGSFVHVGSPCNVQLVSPYGTWEHVSGEISDCKLIERGLFEVRIQFSSEIEVEVYCKDAVRMNVLVVDDDRLCRELSRRFLDGPNVAIEMAENGREAVEIARGTALDLIFSDIEMPEMNGLEAAQAIRDNGYLGRLVAVSALWGAEIQGKCVEAGFDAYIPKPLKQPHVNEQLECLNVEPLFSSLPHDEDLLPIVRDFVISLSDRVRSIQSLAATMQLLELGRICRELDSLAGSLGFEPIAEEAVRIERQISKNADSPVLPDGVKELIHWCRRARARQCVA